jgi:hypothetical protein
VTDTDSVELARRELLGLYEEWFARVGPEPGDFFQRVLDPDWVYIDYNGVQRGKSDYEPYIASVPPGTGPRSPGDLHVRLYRDVAVVDGSYEITSDDGGGTVIRFTAVWLHRDTGWLALAHHTSAVAEH